jgi:hypothetical protein
VPVLVDGRRALIYDLTVWDDKQDEFLLATDHGLCVWSAKWGTCELQRPQGLGDKVTRLLRDSRQRLWLAGRGLWVLRDRKRVASVHPSIPMLADTRVVVMAEAADGRMVIGLEDRGTVFLGLPAGWLDRPPDLPSAPMSWESTRPHEPAYSDPSVVLRECRDAGRGVPDSVANSLLADLRGLVEKLDGRFRVGMEMVFEGRPDIVVRGADVEKLLAEATLVLGKYGSKARFSVWKRRGARGSEAVPVKGCPQP